MDELERRAVEDIRSELILGKREKQRLSEKLDCLILLIGGAWQGESESINKISEIVGIPPPKIIPFQPNEYNENDQLGQEYLQLTSSLLDQQLMEDATIRKTTKVLRPTSAKLCGSARGKASSANRRHVSTPKSSYRPRSATNKKHSVINIENGSTVNPQGKKQQEIPLDQSDNSTMDSFTNMLPMFATSGREAKPLPDIVKRFSLNTNKRENVGGQKYSEKNIPTVLFDPNGIIESKKTRPVSAALQHRQDYVRSQTAKKKKPRAQSAKLAFRHATDLEYDTLVHSHAPMQSPASSPENTKLSSLSTINHLEDDQPISVNISSSFNGRLNRIRVATATANVFPHERDEHALGDVSDALQHVQEMERLFRRNTRRLQQRIGIPASGCI